MGIAQSMDKFTGFEVAHLCHHQSKQGLAGNIKRYAKEDITTALI